ncbi:StAR-related lipid transfer protein 7, mitochondrial [Senna tora]|uniref:StAR-related lipid transfer protein 7, mitochondrial n=1 Tax=Senna tora TaxID=362788 RepID=A0A834U1T4_9FABA|nr:StAR-related lipid transfer protein 7, mitochondrial [Senna tora]
MALLSVFLGILRKSSFVDVSGDLFMFIAPLWIAVIVGVLVGWAWKPKWANFGRDMIDGNGMATNDTSDAPSPSLPTFLASIPSLNSFKFQLPSCIPWLPNSGIQKESALAEGSSSQVENDKSSLLTERDLEHLSKLVEEKDGGPAWIQMMDRSTPNMTYQAWRRDPETGPPQYRSRTVYEDATPDMVRDFFWDDDFRMKWDDMLIHATILEDCSATGTMVVHWVRKFPFFCSDREYVIGRRIWEAGQSYYCVTKGVPCSSVPRRNKPKRVDLYYSSWCIRPAESKKDGKMTACEVLLFHHEDMGIPWEIAKLGVRQGMWGAVKKIDPGLRAYQKERASGAPLSRCACISQITTKVTEDYLKYLENTTENLLEIENQDSSDKPNGRNIPKLLVVGGAIALACTLDRGLLTKAVIFGVARRFAKIGRGL